MARDDKATQRKTGVAAWNDEAGSGASGRSGRAHGAKVASERRRRLVVLALLAVVCVASLACVWPPNESVKRGVWLKGGTTVTMQAKTSDGGDPSDAEVSTAVATIKGRLGAAGISDYEVHAGDGGTIAISLPWFEDAEKLAQVLGGSGLIEFARADEIGDADALARINAGTSNVELKDGTYTSFLDSAGVQRAEVTEVGSGTYAITIFFTDEGTKTFAEVTKELAEDRGTIAIMVNGRVLSAPMVSEEIDGGQVSVTGALSAEEANAFKAVANSEPLPLKLSVVSSEETGPIVGTGGLWALVAAAVAVPVAACVAGFAKFKRLGLLVGGAGLVYGVTLLGLMALASRLGLYVLTMPAVAGGAIAGLGCVAGMWLVVSRFRSMVVDEGRSVRGSAMSCVYDGLKPLLAPCAVLFVASLVVQLTPVPALREFGMTFVFGVVCALAADLWFGATTLRLLAAGAMQEDPAAWGIQAVEGAQGSESAA